MLNGYPPEYATFKHLFQYLGMQLLQELAYIGFCLELTKELFT